MEYKLALRWVALLDTVLVVELSLKLIYTHIRWRENVGYIGIEIENSKKAVYGYKYIEHIFLKEKFNYQSCRITQAYLPVDDGDQG